MCSGQVGRLGLNLYSDQVLTPCIRLVSSLVSLTKPILQMLCQGVLSVGFDGSEEHFCDQSVGKLYGIRSCKTRYGLDLRKRDRLFPAAKCEYSCLFVGELYAEACLKKNLLI